MESQAVVVTAEDMRHILMTKTGLPAATLEGAAHRPLSELGLDSLAVLVLQAAVADQFGVELPDGTGRFSVDGIVSYINQASEARA